jgi:hypothetical protein
MILYHGSSVKVEKPSISYSRIKTDFGKGFYTTPYREQAIERLRYEKPNLQYCFKNQETIDKFLTFNNSEEL